MYKKLIAIPFYIIFFMLSPVFALEFTVNPDLSIGSNKEDIFLSVIYGNNKAEGRLEITNKSDKDVTFGIKATELRHKESGKVAGFGFVSGNDVKSRINIGLRKGEIGAVTCSVSDVDVIGEFTGVIEVNVAGKPVRRLNVKAVKTSLKSFEILEAKNGELNLKVKKPGTRNFFITIINPGESYREIALRDLELTGNGEPVTGEIQPDKIIKLEPSQQKTVRISFSDIHKGSFSGILILRDNYSYKEYPVTLFSPFGFWEILYVKMDRYIYVNFLYVILLVFAGAMASILLTKSVPIASNKKNNSEKITELRELVDNLTAYEPRLRVKFMVELVEAQKINDNTKIFNPSAGERIKKVQGTLTKLEEYLAIRKSLSDLYIEIDGRDYLPFSIEEKIRNKLREADLKLYEGDENTAKQLKEQALKEFEFDKSNFCKNLRKDIGKFIEDHKKETPDKKDEAPFIITIISKLEKEILPAMEDFIKKINAEEMKAEECLKNLRDWELIWQKVNIYCNKLLKSKDYKLKENEVLELLKADNHNNLLKAKNICDSLDYGVTEELIVEAITNHKFCIKYCPSDPDVNGFIKLWLEFEENKFNDSQLLNDFRYIWDFGDMTRRAEGISVYHYYTRRGMLILFRKWLRRNSVIFLRLFGEKGWKAAEIKQIWKEFRVIVEISKFSGNCSIIQTYTTPEPVKVKEPLDKPYRSGITFLDIFGFISVLTLSCLITATNIYDEKFTFTSFKDVISVFLTGFGLEISRENLSKLIEARKGKERQK